jgi:hypothetical protein
VNRCWQQLPSFGWILLVVQSGDHSVVANQSPVANIDSALVLNGAANIDEHVLINMDIFPAISIKKLSPVHQLCFFTSMST